LIQDIIEVEMLLYIPRDSRCNDAVACLTAVESPLDCSAGAHDLSELCCGLNLESDSDDEIPLLFSTSIRQTKICVTI